MAPHGAADGQSIARSITGPQVTFDGTIGRMRIGQMTLGVLLLLSGLVWAAQGLNLPFAPRSFMTADRAWIIIGSGAALAGTALLVRGLRTR